MSSFWGTFSVVSAVCFFGLTAPRIALAQECDPDSGLGCYSRILDCDPDSDPLGCYSRDQGDKLRLSFHQKVDEVLAKYPCAASFSGACSDSGANASSGMTKMHQDFSAICGMSDWDMVQNFACSTDLSIVNPFTFSSSKAWQKLSGACRNLLRTIANEQAKNRLLGATKDSERYEAFDLAAQMTEAPIECGSAVAPAITSLAGQSRLIVGRDQKLRSLSRSYCPEPRALSVSKEKVPN